MLQLREGEWQYSVDEKGRFPIPPKIRREVGEKWVWVWDGCEVTLLPRRVWKEKLATAENPDKMRLDYHPFEDETDSQGRLTIPAEIKKLGELGKDIILVSLGDRLLVRNVPAQEERVLQIAPRPFRSGDEASKWLATGDNVAYFSRPDRVIVGKLISGNGIVFTLDGKDSNGVMVRINQTPYCSFYPLRPKEDEQGKKEKQKSLSVNLLDKFPDFDPDWPDQKKQQWFKDFLQLVITIR